MKKTSMVVAVFLDVLISSFVAMYISVSSAPADRETFAQKELGMPVSGVGMGPYDNVSVPGSSGWMATESAPAGASPVGELLRLQFLANPQTSQSCCPSPFTLDTGCVCISDEDRKTMSSRGGNRLTA